MPISRGVGKPKSVAKVGRTEKSRDSWIVGSEKLIVLFDILRQRGRVNCILKSAMEVTAINNFS